MDVESLFHTFLKIHQPQLESSGVPKVYWEILHKKLKEQIFDAGVVFQLAKVNYDHLRKNPRDPVWKLLVSSNNGISIKDSNNIYLIDHAWMYDATQARQGLLQTPSLLDRMCSLMGYDSNENKETKIDFILAEMWRYNQSFSLNTGSVEDRMPLWYIMDEVGSAINHSDDPNFRTVPFLYLSEGITYTLLFPIKDCVFEEEITRDFVEGQTNDPKKRRALLVPWVNNSFVDENFLQEEPSEEFFLSGHIEESLPQIYDENKLQKIVEQKLKVYSQYSFVNNYLTDSSFEIVENENEADILWLTSHFKNYKELSLNSPNVFINQFPFENVLTTKDLLAVICRRKKERTINDESTLETCPVWLPTTYNLNTELIEFVSYFEQRENKGLDNYWICKPWNLARGLDTHVTNNLFQIIRLPSSGPKIAQKYISNPVLYNREEIGKVKFDIRYVLLLNSVKPLKAYAYGNFFLRFANKPFALNNLDLYQQHFTVMNYEDYGSLFHLKCADFILEWDKQYPDHSWKSYVEPKVLQVFRQVFESACYEEPPKGISKSSQSRAIYAVDFMLEWKNNEMQPKLLEMNFSPDCQRACEYYPDFYNDIFKCLFLDMEDPQVFHRLN